MQYHTGAYILALHNYLKDNKKKKYEVSITYPKARRYTVFVDMDSGWTMEMQIADFWSCYASLQISGRNDKRKRIHLKHRDRDGVQPRDYFTMDDSGVDGEVTSSTGKKTKYSGHFYGDTQLKINSINSQGESVKSEFILR